MRALALILLWAPAQDPKVEHVVLVSIDGLRPDFYTGDFDAPVLKSIASEGAHAKGVESVFPSSTYPAHASIVTGVRPWKHGIAANTTWSEAGTTRDWYWHAKDLKARTLWQAAREKGRKVAITYWPTSVGAEADWVLGEIWDPDGKETAKRLHAASTPGLMVELSLALGIPAEKIAGDKVEIDRFVAAAAAYMFRRYRPNLQLVHLLNVDEVQHRQGRGADAVREAVKLQDANLARIRKAVADSGLADRTALIVVGDHGFTDVSRQIHPNALLAEHGFLELEEGRLKSWRALTRSSGGSAAIHVRDRKDVPAVTDLFRRAASVSGETLYTVLERPELDRLGSNPEAALALDPADGWAFSGALGTKFIDGVPTVKGNHGQLPSRPELRTGFAACGAGIRAGASVGQMSLIDVAPTVAKLLGLDLPDAEGVPVGALLK
jgi:predicted AlkP superfamily pyrophosphatase or phosphodiesterase